MVAALSTFGSGRPLAKSFSAISADQDISTLSTTQIAALTATQLNALSPTQIQSLSGDQVGALAVGA